MRTSARLELVNSIDEIRWPKTRGYYPWTTDKQGIWVRLRGRLENTPNIPVNRTGKAGIVIEYRRRRRHMKDTG